MASDRAISPLLFKDGQSRSHPILIPDSDPQDLFSQLPVELLHHVLSYLAAPYSGLPGTTGLRHWDFLRSRKAAVFRWREAEPGLFKYHPFYCLSMTSVYLRAVVENFCWHLLRRYKHLGSWESKLGEDEPQVIRIERMQKKGRKKPVFRSVWVKWAKNHCAFCGKISQREAIFNNLIKCCKDCDQRQWPDKMTKTTVLSSPYYLTQYDLFFPNPIMDYNSGIWRIKYATYNCMGVDATMFLKKDIEALTRKVHSDNIDASTLDEQPPEVKLARRKTAARKTREGNKLLLTYNRGKWVTVQKPATLPRDEARALILQNIIPSLKNREHQ